MSQRERWGQESRPHKQGRLGKIEGSSRGQANNPGLLSRPSQNAQSAPGDRRWHPTLGPCSVVMVSVLQTAGVRAGTEGRVMLCWALVVLPPNPFQLHGCSVALDTLHS